MTAYPIPRDAITPCMSGDPDRYFPSQPGPVPAALEAECDGCQFRDGCLSWGLTRGEQGIWGGTSEKQRRRMRDEHGITPVRPPVITFVDTPTTKIPHGTGDGLEAHRKNGSKVCPRCLEWASKHRSGISVCEVCGRAMLSGSVGRHMRAQHGERAAS